jgi:predicted tellurium resistance membrane protein TerC
MTELIIALVTLTFLEIVLGVDNVIFISILSGKLPKSQQRRARRVGLLAAMVMRLLLLSSIVWLSRLTVPLFDVMGRGISGRDLILLGGGLFLLAKSTTEIHHNIDVEHEAEGTKKTYLSLASAVVQIAILDIVFSLDSVITAVGMTNHLPVMVAAVVAAMAVMILAANAVGDFVDKHPSVKMLCLAFLLLIGVALLGEGLHFHIPKGYLYFAIAFSAGVEGLNLWARSRREAAKNKAAA